MDTLPRVPAFQPPSPCTAPRVCSNTSESWGKRGVGEQTAGSLASGVPRQGARSQGQWLDQGGTWALSRFFLKKVYLFGSLGWQGWWDFQPGASYTDGQHGGKGLGRDRKKASICLMCIAVHSWPQVHLSESGVPLPKQSLIAGLLFTGDQPCRWGPREIPSGDRGFPTEVLNAGQTREGGFQDSESSFLPIRTLSTMVGGLKQVYHPGWDAFRKGNRSPTTAPPCKNRAGLDCIPASCIPTQAGWAIGCLRRVMVVSWNCINRRPSSPTSASRELRPRQPNSPVWACVPCENECWKEWLDDS